MTHKRVINRDNEGEKRRKEDVSQDQEYRNGAPKMRRIEPEEPLEEKLPEGLEYEGGRKKTEEELAEEWNQKLKDREEEMLREEIERTERMEKAKRMQRGWELKRLCKEMIEENGEKWKKSKERRECEKAEDEERKERKGRAEVQKKEALEKLRKTEYSRE